MAAVKPQVDVPVVALGIEVTDWLEVLDEIEVELLELEEVEPDLLPPEGAVKLRYASYEKKAATPIITIATTVRTTLLVLLDLGLLELAIADRDG